MPGTPTGPELVGIVEGHGKPPISIIVPANIIKTEPSPPDILDRLSPAGHYSLMEAAGQLALASGGEVIENIENFGNPQKIARMFAEDAGWSYAMAPRSSLSGLVSVVRAYGHTQKPRNPDRSIPADKIHFSHLGILYSSWSGLAIAKDAMFAIILQRISDADNNAPVTINSRHLSPVVPVMELLKETGFSPLRGRTLPKRFGQTVLWGQCEDIKNHIAEQGLTLRKVNDDTA